MAKKYPEVHGRIRHTNQEKMMAYPLLREKDEYLMQKAGQLQMNIKEIRLNHTEYTYVRKYISWIKHLLGDNAATSDVIINFQRSVNGTHGGN
jgi:hypothetical protein